MATSSTFELRAAGGTLLAVPAVHFALPFAETVNAVCSNPLTRPDAVAVELGPQTAACLAAWLTELGVGPARRTRLACMLGLLKRNRTLRASVRERAMQLQLETGHELNELSAEVLRDELGFAETSVIPLSPTDSIIEALRCALELGVPVFGVDMEEQPDLNHAAGLFPDANTASGRTMQFVRDSAGVAARDIDPEVNERREIAMAARLKGLLGSYERVLFTGGLAHWERLGRLIDDETVPAAQPAVTPATLADDSLQRIVMHPNLACHSIDRLPLVARLYERARRHPLLSAEANTPEPLSLRKVFDAKIQRFIKRQLSSVEHEPEAQPMSITDARALANFPRVLAHYAAYSLREVPDIAMACNCAKAFLGEDLAHALAKELMRYPWARPEHYTDCGFLEPSEQDARAKTIRLSRDGKPDETFTTDMRQAEYPGNPRADSKEEDADEPEQALAALSNFTWDPWNNLVTANSDLAVQRASPREIAHTAEPFRHSLGDGLAMRATLRAYARGDERFYVRRRHIARVTAEEDLAEGWPVVWIFDDSETAESCRFHNYLVPMSWLTCHARDRASFEQRYATKAHNMCALIGFGRRQWNEGVGEEPQGSSCLFLHGLVLYGPVFNCNAQYTRWIEHSAGRAAPLYRRVNSQDIPDTVVSQCKRELRIELGKLRWLDDMVAMALPFCRSRVTVVAPRSFRLAPTVQAAAARRGKRIAVVPLEHFDAEELARMRRNVTVEGALSELHGETVFESATERRMGERQERFKERVPQRWRHFGL